MGVSDALPSGRLFVNHSPESPTRLDVESLVRIRRHLHRHPELSGREYRTTRYLAEQLGELGIPFRLGPDDRGLIVDLGDPRPRRRMALRGDIDAIPVDDSKSTPYRSQFPNCMHACGHDAHATMLLGALVRLADWFEREAPSGLAVRGLFQPEEEIATGAVRLIDAGALQDVDAILALHVDPTRRAGTVGIRPGVMTAHCDKVTVDVFGKSGHAARPHESIDPINAACQFVQMAYSSLNRKIDSQHPTVFTICQFNGGFSSNVTPDEVFLQGTLRTLDRFARVIAMERITQVANSVAAMTDARFEVSFGSKVPAVEADPRLTRIIRSALCDLLGEDNVQEIAQPSMGGEDFAFYSQQVPASFLRIGSAGDGIGQLPLHNSGFDIDERVLPIGAEVLAQSAIRYLTTDEAN